MPPVIIGPRCNRRVAPLHRRGRRCSLLAGPVTAESSGRIHAVVNSLIIERQELRRKGADRPLLEANRVALVYWQQRLAEHMGAERGATV